MSSSELPSEDAELRPSRSSPTLSGRSPATGALRLLRQASSRRFLREPAARARESAGEQVEERQSDLAYSWPVVLLDLVWNAGFIAAALIVIGLSVDERPSAPLRLWIFGYSAQCCVHMVCVWSEYQRRQENRQSRHRARGRGTSSQRLNEAQGGDGALSEALLRRRSQEGLASQTDEQEGEGRRRQRGPEGRERGEREVGGESEDEGEDLDQEGSLARQVESVNTMFSFVWWVVGLGWIMSTFDDTFQDSPLLSWLCMIFLAFDVFFVIFCTALACVIGIAVCCCLPCIIALLYAVGGKEGAPDEAIEALPRFKFRKSASVRSSLTQLMTRSDSNEVAVSVEDQGGYILPLDASEGAKGRPVAPDDAECCICLGSYDDGSLLRELPCLHHFHQACLDKWLRTKPTCPLCKYDILKKARPTAEAAEPSASSAAPSATSSEPSSTSVVQASGASMQEQGARGTQAPDSLVGAIQATAAGFFPVSSSQD